MSKTDFSLMALGTPNTGELKQIYGAFKALEELTGNAYDYDKMFLLPLNINSIHEQREKIIASNYANYSLFKENIFKMLDKHLALTKIPPKVFITVYTQLENNLAGKNIDAVCRAVKEYYKEHHLGNILTTVLTSRAHKYKYVDLINVPKHLLTLRSRIRLLKNPTLKKKVLVTVGIINNLNQKYIKDKKNELIEKLHSLKSEPDLKFQIDKLKQFISSSKKIVICLGGRVDGPEIKFNIPFAKKLFSDAEKMVKNGYFVAFVNGPRTPNDVCDFVYEKSLSNPNIVFHNCKNITQTSEDKLSSNWRIYSGKYETPFSEMQKIGNIYPGILGFENLLAVHTMDSYACCETANAAINTALCKKGLYIDPQIRRDCYNMYQLLCPRYAIDWDDFISLSTQRNTEPKDLHLQVLSSPLRVFAENVLNKITE